MKHSGFARIATRAVLAGYLLLPACETDDTVELGGLSGDGKSDVIEFHIPFALAAGASTPFYEFKIDSDATIEVAQSGSGNLVITAVVGSEVLDSDITDEPELALADISGPTVIKFRVRNVGTGTADGVVSVLPADASGEPVLICSKLTDGYYYVVNVDSGETLGGGNFYLHSCTELLDTRDGNLMCTRHGDNYHYVTDVVTGEDRSGGQFYLHSCTELIATRDDNVMCTRHGDNYHYLIDTDTGEDLSGGSFYLHSCTELIDTREGDLMCTRLSDNYYYLLNVVTKKLLSAGNFYLHSCTELIPSSD